MIRQFTHFLSNLTQAKLSSQLNQEKVLLQPKSRICDFRWYECYLLVLVKVELLLHLELKIFGYGERVTSANIHLREQYLGELSEEKVIIFIIEDFWE